MCAAPGSKTFQLLEALHANCLPGQTPPGYVVANDADFMRCNLLTHQTKRVCSPCLLVTNHNAERFPVYLSGPAAGADEYGKAAAAAAGGGGGRVEVRFDRILADVPCSGDGTLRKSPDIWRRWNLMGGNSLHPIQLKIALHGARLLQVGCVGWWRWVRVRTVDGLEDSHKHMHACAQHAINGCVPPSGCKEAGRHAWYGIA